MSARWPLCFRAIPRKQLEKLPSLASLKRSLCLCLLSIHCPDTSKQAHPLACLLTPQPLVKCACACRRPGQRAQGSTMLPALAPHSLPCHRAPPSPFGDVLCTTRQADHHPPARVRATACPWLHSRCKGRRGAWVGVFPVCAAALWCGRPLSRVWFDCPMPARSCPFSFALLTAQQSNRLCALTSRMRPRLGQTREQVKSSLPFRSDPRKYFDLLSHPTSIPTATYSSTQQSNNQPKQPSNRPGQPDHINRPREGARMKTSIAFMLLLLVILASTSAMPAVKRKMTKAAALAAAAGGGAAVLGPLVGGPIGGAAAVAGMVLDAAAAGGAAAMPAGPNGNLPARGWLGHVAGVTSGVQAFVAAHPVALGGALVTVTGGVAFYNHGRQGLDLAFGGTKCYQAAMDDYEEVLPQIYGEYTDQTREWRKRAVAVVACGTGTRPYHVQVEEFRADRLTQEKQRKVEKGKCRAQVLEEVESRRELFGKIRAMEKKDKEERAKGGGRTKGAGKERQRRASRTRANGGGRMQGAGNERS